MVDRLKLRLNNAYIFHFFVLVMIALLAGLLFFSRISWFKSTYYSPRYSIKNYPLTGNAQIIQEFESKYPGLYRIDLYFSKNQDDTAGEIIARLKNDSCENTEDIERIATKISDIIDNQPYSFTFPPIDDSLGRKFCLMVEARLLENRVIGIYASQVDVYPDGKALYKANSIEPSPYQPFDKQQNYQLWLPFIQKSQSQAEFDIGFAIHYNPLTGQIIHPLLRQLSANKPNLLGYPGFYIVLLLAYVMMLVILIGFVLKIC